MKPVIIDTNVIEQKLATKLGDPVLANLLIDLYDKYLYCLGLMDGDLQDFFDDAAEMQGFRVMNDLQNLHGVEPLFQSEAFFKVARRGVCVNDRILEKFSDAEAEYWLECGFLKFHPVNNTGLRLV